MRAAGQRFESICPSAKLARPRLRVRRLPRRRARLRLWPLLLTDERFTKDRRLPRKAHLLLIDDDHNTLASLSRAFRLAGHEATVCDNAARAVDLLRAQAFDVILSDVVMPGRSGLELLEDLKKAGVKTPIVLISGQANIGMAVKATKLGALDFLEKPLSTDKLLVTVENALRLWREDIAQLEPQQGVREAEQNGGADPLQERPAEM